MINVMKEHPYRTLVIGATIAVLALWAAFMPTRAHGALLLKLPSSYNNSLNAASIQVATSTATTTRVTK